MPVEQFRGYIAAIVAAAAVIGGAIGAAWAWYQVTINGASADLAIILSVFTGLIGAGTTFLFVAEGASRASYATERAYTKAKTQHVADEPIVPLPAVEPPVGPVPEGPE
jgi:hypothetical protein